MIILPTTPDVTRVSLYHTVKTKCVAMLLIELQSPVVSVGNTIRTQMFHEESTCSKQINQLNILPTTPDVTRVSLYHTVKTKCVAMLLIELQSPVVSVGNTIRTQMFHEESTCSKQINQLNILRLNILRRRQ